jgi:hypothetical protein
MLRTTYCVLASVYPVTRIVSTDDKVYIGQLTLCCSIVTLLLTYELLRTLGICSTLLRCITHPDARRRALAS